MDSFELLHRCSLLSSVAIRGGTPEPSHFMSNGLTDARRAGRLEISIAIPRHPVLRAAGQTYAIELLDNMLELVGDDLNELAGIELTADDDVRPGPTVQCHDLGVAAAGSALCGLAPPQNQLQRSRALDPGALRPEGARALPHRSKHREERLANIQILR
jgi:hypothetical protein